MENIKKWTDEELIQVYDLQEKFTEKVLDFVRHSEENDVYNFLNIIPELHNYDSLKSEEKKLYRQSEIDSEKPDKEKPQGRYIYKDLFENWKGADTLREVFEEKYQWEFTEARPEVLAVFTGNKDRALEKYSIDRYEKLRAEIPQKLQNTVKNLIKEYPKEIEEKAISVTVYGYTDEISNSALLRYRNEHMPEFEKLQSIIFQESTNTIVAAYDLQAGLKIYHSELEGRYLTDVIKNFLSDKKIFEMVYGERSAELLKKSKEEVLKLASRYDFVNTEEKVPVIENHKICLFGTSEQKLKIPYKSDPFCISDKDFEIIIEEESKKYEREGFSRRYYPNSKIHKEYSNQPYKIIGRVKIEKELQPHWNIIFEDGKIITAQADEIISSQINERFYGEQVENFGRVPISKILIIDDKEKLSLSEGKEKISAIVHQLKLNGESVSKIKDLLEEERRNLSNANAR